MRTRLIIETTSESGLCQKRYLTIEEIRNSVLGAQNYINLLVARNEEALNLKLEALRAEKND